MACGSRASHIRNSPASKNSIYLCDASLDVEYAELPGTIFPAKPEPTLIAVPTGFLGSGCDLIHATTVLCTPKTLTSCNRVSIVFARVTRQLTYTFHHLDTDSSANGVKSDSPPALAITTSAGRSNASLTCRNNLSTSRSTVRSVGMARTFVVPLFSPSKLRTVSSSFSFRRPARTTPDAAARTQTRAAALKR